MNYRELTQYIQTLTESGYDVSEYIVDLRAKFHIPLSVWSWSYRFPFALKSPRVELLCVGLVCLLGSLIGYCCKWRSRLVMVISSLLPAAWISHLVFASAAFIWY
jgi:lipopolysaccharide export LptBFGC system permease protein LptF